MILFVEDVLLEEAGKRIVRELNSNLRIDAVMGKRGFDYLKTSVPKIRRSAPKVRFLVLFDADRLGNVCPAEFISHSFGQLKPASICIRFAVLEVENWLIADRENLSHFLDVSRNKISPLGDKLVDAKEHIVSIARHSRNRSIKSDIVPDINHSTAVGPAYNDRLSEFIRYHWDVISACGNSESLKRACDEIATL